MRVELRGVRWLAVLFVLVVPATASAQVEAPADRDLIVAPGTFAAGGRVVVSGTGVVHLGSARVRVRGTRTWRPRVAPGRYMAKLRVARRTVARFPVTVTPAVPVAAASAGVFPVQGAWTFGEGIGADRGNRAHQGQDVLAAEGTPVVSPVDGTVFFRKVQESAAGHYLVIRDRAGADYVLMHLLAGSERVDRGDAVQAGQVIGQVGSTGNAQGSVLHFELWPDGWYAPGSSPVDPLPQLKAWAGAP